ncbi:MAG: YicC family protein [Arenimonas sp.]|nr:YicC family protein [Arenimonas sp.]MBP6309141.1 YicC family protein [Arenimonas sp.]
MIRSMTAYAQTESTSELGLLSCEMRSVNHRYLELSLRVPEELRALENYLRERISQKISRGKIDLSIRFKPTQQQSAEPQINQQVLQSYAKLNLDLNTKFPGMRSSFTELLKLPGVMQEQVSSTDELATMAKQQLESTLEEFIQARGREGGKLAQVMMDRLQSIEQIVQQIRAYLPEIRSVLKARMEAKLADLKMPLDPGRLEQEVVLNLQKMDVDEELDRLTSHISEARRILSLPEAVGRRLDFMLQEFNREANTLGSKSVDQKTSKASVELKVLIEQIREQVQNLE